MNAISVFKVAYMKHSTLVTSREVVIPVPVVGEGVVGRLGCNNVLHMSAFLQHSMDSCFL